MHVLLFNWTIAIEEQTQDWFGMLIARQRKPIRFIASDRKRLSFDNVKLSIHIECKFSEMLTLNFGLNYQNKAKAKLTNMIKLIRVSSNKTFCVVNQRVFMTTTTLTNITATTHGSIYLDYLFHVRSHKSSKSKHIICV